MESKERSFAVKKRVGVIFALSREGGQFGGDVLLLRVTSPSGGNKANCGRDQIGGFSLLLGVGGWL